MYKVRATTPKEFRQIFQKQDFKILQYCYVVEQYIEMKGFMFWDKDGFYKPDEPYTGATGYIAFDCVERIREKGKNRELLFLEEVFINSTNEKELPLNMIRSLVVNNNPLVNNYRYKFYYNWKKCN